MPGPSILEINAIESIRWDGPGEQNRMNKRKVLYADSSFEDLRDFENALATVGATVVHGNCKTPADVIASGSDAVCIVTELISLDERATTHKK